MQFSVWIVDKDQMRNQSVLRAEFWFNFNVADVNGLVRWIAIIEVWKLLNDLI